MQIDLDPLSATLVTLGCPVDRSLEMAKQLDRRARQLSEIKGRTYDEALVHLLRMMAGGWAAKGIEGSNLLVGSRSESEEPI
ncbi:MAG: hypothetical protein EXS25_09495 [Pedosphaera sp.]|nr:hypothetical protein [Pedosphaera sp.]